MATPQEVIQSRIEEIQRQLRDTAPLREEEHRLKAALAVLDTAGPPAPGADAKRTRAASQNADAAVAAS